MAYVLASARLLLYHLVSLHMNGTIMVYLFGFISPPFDEQTTLHFSHCT